MNMSTAKVKNLLGWFVRRDDNKWWHALVSFALVGVVIVGGNLAVEKAFGVLPAATTTDDAGAMQDHYRAGDYGHRHGQQFPDRIKRMAKQAWDDKYGGTASRGKKCGFCGTGTMKQVGAAADGTPIHYCFTCSAT